jgi:hypothetical protein
MSTHFQLVFPMRPGSVVVERSYPVLNRLLVGAGSLEGWLKGTPMKILITIKSKIETEKRCAVRG